ncbi:MAG: hypothetical protein R3322_00350 [Kiloniellales bacterium]|nr:hypothetical protein [Kiloniellales bacterium]
MREPRPQGQNDVVDILMDLGIDRVNATMIIPFVWFTPSTVDPYAPNIIMLVEGIQSYLSRLGYFTRRDGFVDDATMRALRIVAGPQWKSRPWVNIVEDVLNASPTKRAPVNPFDEGLGALREIKGGRLAMGNLSTTSWCSKRHPKPNCRVLAGIAIPMDAQTLAVFKGLQTQLNRMAAVGAAKAVGIDGRIGPDTIDSVQKAQDALGMSIVPFGTEDGVASVADVLLAEFKDYADQRRAPARPPSPPPEQPPSIASPSGQVIHPPDLKPKGGLMEFAMSPIGLAAIGGGILLAMTQTKKPAKKKGRR